MISQEIRLLRRAASCADPMDNSDRDRWYYRKGVIYLPPGEFFFPRSFPVAIKNEFRTTYQGP